MSGAESPNHGTNPGNYQPPGTQPFSPQHPSRMPGASPQTPYGMPGQGYPMMGRDPHRRPVRITVVAILTFVYSAVTLLGGLFTAFITSNAAKELVGKMMNSASNDSGVTIPPMPMPSYPVLGIDLGAIGLTVFSVILTAALVWIGFMLLKRKGAAPMVLLGVTIIIVINEFFQITANSDYQAQIAAWVAEVEKVTDKPSSGNQFAFQSSNMQEYIGLFVGLAAKITILALVFSVGKWFRGEAVFQPDGPQGQPGY